MNKIAKSFLLILSLFLFLSSCLKDDINFGFDGNYPTRYCFIDNQIRQELNNLISLDSNLNIMTVDSFGFFDRKNEQTVPSSYFNGTINNQDSVLIKTKEFLIKYSEITGTSDASILEVNKVNGFWKEYGGKYVQKNAEDRNRWWIQFENQNYNGLKVYGTEIGVYVCPRGVYQAYGNWFSKIYVPDTEQINFSEAKRKLEGKTLEYADWGGSKKWTISLDDFYDDDLPQKVIFPYRNGNCIEMRVCWFITSKTIWNFFVDVISGELIFAEQTVIF